MRNRVSAVIISAVLFVSNIGIDAKGQELTEITETSIIAEENLEDENAETEPEILTQEESEDIEKPEEFSEISEDPIDAEEMNHAESEKESIPVERVIELNEALGDGPYDDMQHVDFTYGDTLTLKGTIGEVKLASLLINSLGNIESDVKIRIKCLDPQLDNQKITLWGFHTALHNKKDMDFHDDSCLEQPYKYECTLKYNEYVEVNSFLHLLIGNNDFGFEADIPEIEGTDIRAEFEFTIKDNTKYVESVSIPKTTSIRPGKSKSILKSQTPSDGIPIIEWNSDNKNVVTVDKNGRITGVSNGTAIITAKLNNGNQYKTTVTVEDPKLESNSLYITKEKKKTIKVTGNVSDIKFLSENNNIATVDNKGRVTGKKKGSTRIYIYVGRFTLECKVNVEEPMLMGGSVTMDAGNYKKLSVSGTKQVIKWKSLDKKVAVVDNNGLLVGIGKGKTKITANVGGREFSCNVKVSSAKLKNSYIKMDAGDTRTIKTNGKYTNVKWSSKNSKVAKVDSKGRVTGKKAGITIVSAEIKGKKYYCTIKVTSPKLDTTSITLDRGEKQKLSVSDTKKKVTYSTSSSKVAAVDKNGNVTAKSRGSAVITAKAGNKKLKCKVTVREEKPSYVIMMEDAKMENHHVWVNIKNTGNKTLRIYSKDLTWENNGHECFDLNMDLYEGEDNYSGKRLDSVDIKPGKTVELKLRIAKGWVAVNCNVKDKFTELKYTFKYDNVYYYGLSSEQYDTVYVKQ